MFTPPTSPRPKKTHDRQPQPPQTPVLESGSSKPFTNDIRRRTIGRRIICTVVLVPIILVFITLSTRYLVHPIAFDLFLEGVSSSSWEKLSSTWIPHDPHQPLQPRQVPPSPSVFFPSSAPPAATSSNSLSSPPTPTSGVPPVPTIPSNPPVLPTPFPQPFDADLTQNFSSVSCFNFFSNMTTTPTFRTCRPLSLLLGSSADFINAQTNLTQLNTILWGTCNTNTAKDQCLINMDWFTTTLQDVCKKDLEDRNALAVNTLIGLQAYALVRETGCQDDPTSNTYCYINAVRNPTASDLYFYSLPLGLGLPNSTLPSCSSCLKTLLGSYASALKDPNKGKTLTGLQKTYEDASRAAVEKCGTGYALTQVANGARSVMLGRAVTEEGPMLWRWWRCSGSLVFGVVMVLQTLLLLVP